MIPPHETSTGYGGAAYTKRTSDPMCTELGPGKPYLQEYIETAGTTALCSVATSDGCNDRQRKYVEKMKAAGADGVAKQLARLGGGRTAALAGRCGVVLAEEGSDGGHSGSWYNSRDHGYWSAPLLSLPSPPCRTCR